MSRVSTLIPDLCSSFGDLVQEFRRRCGSGITYLLQKLSRYLIKYHASLTESCVYVQHFARGSCVVAGQKQRGAANFIRCYIRRKSAFLQTARENSCRAFLSPVTSANRGQLAISVLVTAGRVWSPSAVQRGNQGEKRIRASRLFSHCDTVKQISDVFFWVRGSLRGHGLCASRWLSRWESRDVACELGSNCGCPDNLTGRINLRPSGLRFLPAWVGIQG